MIYTEDPRYVVNHRGQKVYYQQAVEQMDEGIRERLNADLAPCEDQTFFDEYCKAHKATYGTAFYSADNN